MTDIEVPSTSGYIVNVVLNVFSALTAIVFNSITIQAIRKTSSLPNPLKILLLSLAYSDLAVGLVAQPLWIVTLSREEDTEVLCIIQSALANASFLGIMALNVDRFLAVHLHLRYRELVTYKRVLRLAILTWVLNALLSSICCLVTENLNPFMNITIIVWSLCLIFLTVISCRLYFAVRVHTKQIQALQLKQTALSDEVANASRLRKSAVSSFYVNFVFLVCFLPFYCSLIRKFFMSEAFVNSQIWQELFSLSRTLMFMNSCLNPVIYCWRMRDIRHAIKDILRNTCTH